MFRNTLKVNFCEYNVVFDGLIWLRYTCLVKHRCEILLLQSKAQNRRTGASLKAAISPDISYNHSL